MHLNLESKSQKDIPDFHFLNLVEENPYASIEEIISRDDYYPVELNNGYSLNDSLYEERNHALLFIHNHTFFQKKSINSNWILLDTGSSIDVFWNPSLLNNIHRLDKMTNIHCNTGVFTIDNKGARPGYGIVWFNRDGITNILLMENSTKKFTITYNISTGDNLILQKDSEKLVFNRSPLGLYFHDDGARKIIIKNDKGKLKGIHQPRNCGSY